MPTDKDQEERIRQLEEDFKILKGLLGHFSVGLDKVSHVQANQTSVIEGLLQANETQARLLKKLIDNTEQNNKLLQQNNKLMRRYLEKGKDK